MLVANILGGKLNPIQCWITESKLLLSQVSVHKEGNAHAVHHVGRHPLPPEKLKSELLDNGDTYSLHMFHTFLCSGL